MMMMKRVQWKRDILACFNYSLTVPKAINYERKNNKASTREMKLIAFINKNNNNNN